MSDIYLKSTKVLSLGAIAVMLTVLVVGYSSPVVALESAADHQNICAVEDNIFCDEFYGTTHFMDENAQANWNRFPDDFDNAADYVNYKNENFLRLNINENATTDHYSDANISTAEINQVNKFLQFGVNTRAEVRMRYSDGVKPDIFDPGTAKGSAGFLYWNYFQTVPDPENGVVAVTQEAFGFTWQDADSSPTPGLWVANIAGGVPGGFFYVPAAYPNLDMTEYHVYAIERRHDSMTYYIDDVLVGQEPLNQTGTLQVPDDHKFAIDTWYDNASYQFEPSTFTLTLNKQDIEEDSYVDLDYMRVTEL